MLIIVVILKSNKMKKKILGVVVFLVGALGVMYIMGVFDGGKATEEDNAQGETTNEVIGDVLEDAENIKMPDSEEDTTELDLGLDDEEFDPEAML